jgi:hypothetical protein
MINGTNLKRKKKRKIQREKTIKRKMEKKDNIILHKKILKDKKTSILEFIPPFLNNPPEDILSIDSSGNIFWTKIPGFDIPEIFKPKEILNGRGIKVIPDEKSVKIEVDLFHNNKLLGTELYYKNGRLGISREPLHSYKFDISVPENTLLTAFHVGDGKYGFSMGNGTEQGFLPEIIGMGSDEYDAGLYFLGKSGNDISSNIPLIIIDGRDNNNSNLKNRPIFGVTSGNYSDYKFLIDQFGKIGIGKSPKKYKMEVEGSIEANDFILDGLSLKLVIDVIKEHQDEIDRLKDLIKSLQK